MTHLHQHTPHPCQPTLHEGHRPRFRMLLLLPLTGLIFALASCSGGGSFPEPPTVAATDTQPIGEGLKVIGYALLGAAVVVVLGRLIRS
jgi:hypothetical protein